MVNLEIKGVDLSKHQKSRNIDYAALKKAGYDFAILRAGFGMYRSQRDAEFENHYQACKNAGVYCGAYIYSYAMSESEAKREADCFLKCIDGKKLEYPVAFDIEDKSQKQLSTAKRTDIALAFLEKVESEGYYTMLYCSADWAKNRLDMDRLKQFDVWLACYTTEERRKQLYTRDILGIWQKRSDLLVPAYSGNLDEDVAYKDYAAIIRRAGLNHL